MWLLQGEHEVEKLTSETWWERGHFFQCLFLREGERVRERERERGRQRFQSGLCTVTLGAQTYKLWDHDLSWSQGLMEWATGAPQEGSHLKECASDWENGNLYRMSGRGTAWTHLYGSVCWETGRRKYQGGSKKTSLETTCHMQQGMLVAWIRG